MTRPADRDLVVTALRLGWTLAEIRGRNRPDPPPTPTTTFPTGGNALPLRVERDEAAQEAEAQAVVSYLATRLHVDVLGDAHTDYLARLTTLINDVHTARASGGDAHAAWEALAEWICTWDGEIQNYLSAASDSQNTGYQLGRALSESFWALDGATAASWKLLLGDRSAELTRLVGRLSAYFEPLTAPAISGSLKVWHVVVNDPAWLNAADAVRQLYLQVRRWYGLLVLDQNPQTLIQPGAFLRNWRTTLRAVRVFLPQLLVGFVSFAALAGLVALLAVSQGSAWLNILLGALGTLGLSGAALQARLKTTTNSLSDRLRNEAYADLAAEAITTPPTMPGRLRRTRQRRTAKAVRNQTCRPVINAPVAAV